jgi:hypothetical protein
MSLRPSYSKPLADYSPPRTHTRLVLVAVSPDGCRFTREATHRSPYAAWAAVANAFTRAFGGVNWRPLSEGCVVEFVAEPKRSPLDWLCGKAGW